MISGGERCCKDKTKKAEKIRKSKPKLRLSTSSLRGQVLWETCPQARTARVRIKLYGTGRLGFSTEHGDFYRSQVRRFLGPKFFLKTLPFPPTITRLTLKKIIVKVKAGKNLFRSQ